ncbi:MAG: hypothetical protein ACREBN_05745 [Burkholderiaceae bacterium]
MKRVSILLLIAAATAPALAADVGVSVTIGQPGFYGTLDIGNFPQPRLIYPQPVIIEQVRVVQPVAPIYLHVPPGHAKDWRKHCKKYDACGRPVYFVQDDWYNNVYVPEYRKQHGNSQGKGNGKGKGNN